MSTNYSKKTSKGNGGSPFSSVRGKFLITGALGVIAALTIGLVGITSTSRNSKNSEVVSLVNDIHVMQTQNLANDALYQYYVDQSYINDTIANLDSMQQKATRLKSIYSKKEIAPTIKSDQGMKAQYSDEHLVVTSNMAERLKMFDKKK